MTIKNHLHTVLNKFGVTSLLGALPLILFNALMADITYVTSVPTSHERARILRESVTRINTLIETLSDLKSKAETALNDDAQ